jgi:carbamoyl-phosphate synthase small subunit
MHTICPEIGNTGTNPEDEESRGIFLSGFVVRDHVDFPSNWRSRESLDAYLKRHDVPGISGIDTRALVRKLRSTGSLNGIIARGAIDLAKLRARAAALPSMAGLNLVDDVTCAEPFKWTESKSWSLAAPPKPVARRYHVVAYDYGIKRNILRELVGAGFDVTVVPAQTTAEAALALQPDGIFLSNGPADPREVKYAPPTVRKLIEKKPTFGICLGHQILGLALGATTFKLRFGHHGGNHPVKDLTTGKVEITAQNHGFAVDAPVDRCASTDFGEVEVSHVALNDGVVEGLRAREVPAFSVQYHPEAAAGPHDAGYLFDRFAELLEGDSE